MAFCLPGFFLSTAFYHVLHKNARPFDNDLYQFYAGQCARIPIALLFPE